MENNMPKNAPWPKLFPKMLEKKISKTAEARTGKGIYKRRNSRSYRVVMKLSTYRRIMQTDPTILNKYTKGYAVRISPREYFPNCLLDPGLILGVNAFIYYKIARDYDTYPPDPTWSEVTELYTSGNASRTGQEWIGEYALFVNNRKPAVVSVICGTNTSLPTDVAQRIKEAHNLESLPAQAGLGNFDYDFASKEEIDSVQYQLSYMICCVRGMSDLLYEKCLDPETQELFHEKAIAAANLSREHYERYFQSIKSNIEAYCVAKNLIDFDRLSSVRAWSLSEQEPICPLCLETLLASDFLETAAQDEGREEEDNTQSKIALMHIQALKPGEFNHRVYNLGWGHKHCNTIQSGQDINETLEDLIRIIRSNGYDVTI